MVHRGVATARRLCVCVVRACYHSGCFDRRYCHLVRGAAGPFSRAFDLFGCAVRSFLMFWFPHFVEALRSHVRDLGRDLGAYQTLGPRGGDGMHQV